MCPAAVDPAGGDTDKLGQESLETSCPAHSVKPLLWQQSEDVKVEVLEHSRNNQEDHILIHEGEWHVCPSEIVVLDIEVLLARASIVIIADGSVFARNNIVGKYAAILINLLLFKEQRLVWIQFDRLLCSLYNKAEMPILSEIVKGEAVHFAQFIVDAGFLPRAAIGKGGITMLAIARTKIEILAML